MKRILFHPDAAEGRNQSGLGFSPSPLAGAWTKVQTTLLQPPAGNFSARMLHVSMALSDLFPRDGCSLANAANAARRPDSLRPGALRPKSLPPEALRPEAIRPETSRPEVSHDSVPQYVSEASRLEASRPEGAVVNQPRASESASAALGQEPEEADRPERAAVKFGHCGTRATGRFDRRRGGGAHARGIEMVGTKRNSTLSKVWDIRASVPLQFDRAAHPSNCASQSCPPRPGAQFAALERDASGEGHGAPGERIADFRKSAISNSTPSRDLKRSKLEGPERTAFGVPSGILPRKTVASYIARRYIAAIGVFSGVFPRPFRAHMFIERLPQGGARGLACPGLISVGAFGASAAVVLIR